MPSFIYDSATFKSVTGGVDLDTDSFKVLLVTSAYTPNQKTHVNRSDISGEVAAGGGYTTGGQAVTVSVTNDTANDRTDITLGGTTFAAVTLTARAAVYYKNTGVASTDTLVGYIDFGSDLSPAAVALILTASIWRIPSPVVA